MRYAAPDILLLFVGGHHQRDAVVLHLDPLRHCDHGGAVWEPHAGHPPRGPAPLIFRSVT